MNDGAQNRVDGDIAGNIYVIQVIYQLSLSKKSTTSILMATTSDLLCRQCRFYKQIICFYPQLLLIAGFKGASVVLQQCLQGKGLKITLLQK